MSKKSFTPLDKSKNTRKNYLTGFTLLELVIVIVIIGILSTLALTQYGGYREGVLDQEAQVNLRLILSAERVWRMESNNNQYISPPTVPPPVGPLPNNTNGVNQTLRLTIPITNAGWNYRVNIAAAGQQFAAQATRTQAPVRWWCIRQPTAAVPDPQPTAGACPF